MLMKIWTTASAALAFAYALNAAAANPSDSVAARTLPEKEVIAISIDNDLFVPSTTDRDFTAGIAITYSGRPGLEHWRKLDDMTGAIDHWLGIQPAAVADSDYTPSIEFGGYGFTPDNIESKATEYNDRPYASLVYLAAGRTYNSTDGNSAWTSSLTIGALGLSLFETAQNRIHRTIGSEQAEGWDHQISDGGELTFRYQAAYHNYWNSSSNPAQFKTTYFGSLGYLTETGIAISTRRGRISSPDNRFNPELVSYGERVNEAAATPFTGEESYFWGGAALKVRFYNAFLQGQFRDSHHTLSGSELRPVLVEAWAGYTRSFNQGFNQGFDRSLKLSYIIRAQSSEIRRGEGDRGLLWGGFVLSQSL